MQVELPPIKVVGEEGVIICATVAGVGKHIATTFGEAEEDVSRRRRNTSVIMDSLVDSWCIQQVIS